ncbi:unnamed protein product [Rhizophagus irregularis]|nr:unnamed protein product [Rhizophagus irregularis]
MYLKPALEKTYADRRPKPEKAPLIGYKNAACFHILTEQDISIPPEIKDFISDNISLLPREIYIQLVERGLNGKNRSTFAWTELSKKDITEMTLISAQKWKCSWI